MRGNNTPTNWLNCWKNTRKNISPQNALHTKYGTRIRFERADRQIDIETATHIAHSIVHAVYCETKHIVAAHVLRTLYTEGIIFKDSGTRAWASIENEMFDWKLHDCIFAAENHFSIWVNECTVSVRNVFNSTNEWVFLSLYEKSEDGIALRGEFELRVEKFTVTFHSIETRMIK